MLKVKCSHSLDFKFDTVFAIVWKYKICSILSGEPFLYFKWPRFGCHIKIYSIAIVRSIHTYPCQILTCLLGFVFCLFAFYSSIYRRRCTESVWAGLQLPDTKLVREWPSAEVNLSNDNLSLFCTFLSKPLLQEYSSYAYFVFSDIKNWEDRKKRVLDVAIQQ